LGVLVAAGVEWTGLVNDVRVLQKDERVVYAGENTGVDVVEAEQEHGLPHEGFQTLTFDFGDLDELLHCVLSVMWIELVTESDF
jgi:hypothetical protein